MRHRDADALIDYRISHESTYDVKSSMSLKKKKRYASKSKRNKNHDEIMTQMKNICDD